MNLHSDFIRNIYKSLNNYEKAVKLREKSYTYEDIINHNKQPLNILENLLYLWPPCDIRINAYQDLLLKEGSDRDTEVALIEDIVKSAEYITSRKDFSNGIIELSINFIENLDEIERYNRAVIKHNREWVKKGKPTKIFDPVHGEEYEIEDTYVDPVFITGNAVELGEVELNVSKGELAKARPQLKRKLLVKIIYKLIVNKDSSFTLEYAAYNAKNELLYYNSVTNYDMAKLVRRSVQEMWGYPYTKDKYIKGISLFLSGSKLEICNRDNKKPSFLLQEDKISLKDNIDFIRTERKINFLKKKIDTLRFFFPIYAFVMLPISAIGVLYFPNFFLVLSIINIIATFCARMSILDNYREISVLTSEKSFL